MYLYIETNLIVFILTILRKIEYNFIDHFEFFNMLYSYQTYLFFKFVKLKNN